MFERHTSMCRWWRQECYNNEFYKDIHGDHTHFVYLYDKANAAVIKRDLSGTYHIISKERIPNFSQWFVTTLPLISHHLLGSHTTQRSSYF